MLAEYEYDAWGNCTIVSDTNGIAEINPLRYRGYYYDADTDLYYLQSRYYDSNIGRFINADEPIVLGQYQPTIVQFNLFAYAGNNSITNKDLYGYKVVKIKNIAYYDTKYDIFYYGVNAPQRLFGYCVAYDVASKLFMDLNWMRVKFNDPNYKKNGKQWMIEFWKGYYLNVYKWKTTIGCEIGIYYRYKDSKLKGMYWCLKNNEYLMKMSLWSEGKLVLQMMGTTWWLTGFKPFNNKTKKISTKKLDMHAELFFENVEMAKAFESAAKKSKDRYGNKFKNVSRSYYLVCVRW